MEYVSLRFLKEKGSVKVGYVGKYDQLTADGLIAKGIAEKVPAVVKTKTKEKRDV